MNPAFAKIEIFRNLRRIIFVEQENKHLIRISGKRNRRDVEYQIFFKGKNYYEKIGKIIDRRKGCWNFIC